MPTQSWIFDTPQAHIVTEINGIDRTAYILMGSLSITDEITSKVNTCSFNTYDLDGTWVPTTSDTVKVYDTEGNLIFAGFIVSANETRSGINPDDGEEVLRYAVQCQDYTKILQRKLIVETYNNKDCKTILQEMVDKYFPTEEISLELVENGPTIENITFNYAPADQAITALATNTGYQWYIDYNKTLHFFSQDNALTQYTITDDSDNWTQLKINPDTSQLRNRVYIRGGIYYSDPYLQKIVADGEQEEFTLAYTPDDDNFSIEISGTPYSVGLDGIDESEDYDFLLTRKEKAVKMGETAWAQANTPLAADTVLDITYNYEIPVLVVQEDSDSISAMKTIEGGDGVYEYVVNDENITSINAARLRAAAELRDYANPVIKGSVISYETHGIKSGDLMSINLARRGLNSSYLIQNVKIKQLTTNTLQYTISFSGKLYGLVDILIALFKQSQKIILGLDEVLDAFTALQDATGGIYDGTPSIVESAPPFAWSNDAGTTTNKMRWSLFEWA